VTGFAEDALENGEDTLKERYLTFITGTETYGIDIRYVMEIVGIQTITEMPEQPHYVKGIINLRGIIIPLMDIRLRFGKLPREYDDRTCVIVINYNGVSYGFIVDSVSEVLTIAEKDIAERPKLNSGDINGYVKSIGKINHTVILLIDCAKLLSLEALDHADNYLSD
jgi:purine-binding chemotaxis protein CheW